jgi:hypothetical protein
MPAPHRPPLTAPKQTALEQALRRQTERRRQIRGLLLLAGALLIFILLRAGLHTVFTPGWWRLW